MNDPEFSRRQAIGRLGLMAAGAAAATPFGASGGEAKAMPGMVCNVRDFKAAATERRDARWF